LRDVWLGVNLRIVTNKTCVENKLEHVLIFLLTILDAIFYVIAVGGGNVKW
jgi:hypothetical protein